jgi:hypothetical protein
MNQKQKALLSLAVSKTLEQGSGVEIADRKLVPGEFAPIMSKNNSGGVVFKTQSIPQDVCESLGVAFLPVVDHNGREQLGLFLHGTNFKLVPLARLDAKQAQSLIADLMASAAHYSDPLIQAEVVKGIGQAVVANDMALKDELVLNTERALQKSFSKMITKRLDAKQREFDAAVAEIERQAVIKAQAAITKSMLELAEVASIDQTSVRHARLSELLPTIKNMVTK